MADFIIKSAAGTGNKTLIQGQDQSSSNYAIQVGDAGATTLTNATLTTATMTAGTIASAVSLNHDAQKYAWHRGLTNSVDQNSDGDLDFSHNVFTGSGLSESGGVITIGAGGAGLYYVGYGISNSNNSVGNHDWSLYRDSTKISSTRVYFEYDSGDGGKPAYLGGTTAVLVPLAVNETIKVYGQGYCWGSNTNSMTWFAGCRIGAKT